MIVTNNLFGDIVTDLGASLQGGIGLAAIQGARIAGASTIIAIASPIAPTSSGELLRIA